MKGSGEPEEVGLLLTKGRAFTGDPRGSCWSEQSHALGALFLSTQAVSAVLMVRLDVAEALRNLEQVPDETAEAFYHFRFDIDGPSWYLNVWMPALTQAIGEQFVNEMYPPERRQQAFSGPTGWVFKGEAWVHKETLLLHRFLWKQASTKTGEHGFTSTVTISRFDQAVPEVPGVEAIMAVGPCTGDGRLGATTTPTPTPTATPATAATGSLGHIAFRSYVDGNADIYVVDTDGSNQTRITHRSTLQEAPVWSPDGSKIVFASVSDGNSDIYVINADGSHPTQLTRIPGLSLACCPA